MLKRFSFVILLQVVIFSSYTNCSIITSEDYNDELFFKNGHDWNPTTIVEDISTQREVTINLKGSCYDFDVDSCVFRSPSQAPVLNVKDNNTCSNFYARMEDWIKQCILTPTIYVFTDEQGDEYKGCPPDFKNSLKFTLDSIYIDIPPSNHTKKIKFQSINILLDNNKKINILSHLQEIIATYKLDLALSNSIAYATSDQVFIHRPDGIYGCSIDDQTYDIPNIVGVKSPENPDNKLRTTNLTTALFRKANAVQIVGITADKRPRRQKNLKASVTQNIETSSITSSLTRTSEIQDVNNDQIIESGDNKYYRVNNQEPKEVASPYLYSNNQFTFLTRTFEQSCYEFDGLNYGKDHKNSQDNIKNLTVRYTLPTQYKVYIECNAPALNRQSRSDGPFYQYDGHSGWHVRNQNAILPQGLYEFDCGWHVLKKINKFYSPTSENYPLEKIITTIDGIRKLDELKSSSEEAGQVYNNAKALHGYILAQQPKSVDQLLADEKEKARQEGRALGLTAGIEQGKAQGFEEGKKSGLEELSISTEEGNSFSILYPNQQIFLSLECKADFNEQYYKNLVKILNGSQYFSLKLLFIDKLEQDLITIKPLVAFLKSTKSNYDIDIVHLISTENLKYIFSNLSNSENHKMNKKEVPSLSNTLSNRDQNKSFALTAGIPELTDTCFQIIFYKGWFGNLAWSDYSNAKMTNQTLIYIFSNLPSLPQNGDGPKLFTTGQYLYEGQSNLSQLTNTIKSIIPRLTTTKNYKASITLWVNGTQAEQNNWHSQIQTAIAACGTQTKIVLRPITNQNNSYCYTGFDINI